MKKNRYTQVFEVEHGRLYAFYMHRFVPLHALRVGVKNRGGELFCGKSVCYIIICVLPYVKLL